MPMITRRQFSAGAAASAVAIPLPPPGIALPRPWSDEWIEALCEWDALRCQLGADLKTMDRMFEYDGISFLRPRTAEARLLLGS
jgi:hypothetical protein